MKTRQFILAKCYDKHGYLLGMASNSYTKTHPLQKHFAIKVGHDKKEYLHAEIAAILRCKDIPIHTIKVERIGSQGQRLPARPCPICQAAITAFGIKKVIHT